MNYLNYLTNNFSAKFRRETAQLVLDNGYTHKEASDAMGGGYSTVGTWVRQLRAERRGENPQSAPMTPEQIEIRTLKKRIQEIELEKEILKKATALLMPDSMCCGQLFPDIILGGFSATSGRSLPAQQHNHDKPVTG